MQFLKDFVCKSIAAVTSGNRGDFLYILCCILCHKAMAALTEEMYNMRLCKLCTMHIDNCSKMLYNMFVLLQMAVPIKFYREVHALWQIVLY